MIHCLKIRTSINEILLFGMISHVLVNSYVGGINTPKRVNTYLINRQLATQHPIVRLFTSGWKKLIAQLEIRHYCRRRWKEKNQGNSHLKRNSLSIS